tara:strand:- start:85 stop:903 length:819 start_codon:yes stop_codon:yes gene_type:complete
MSSPQEMIIKMKEFDAATDINYSDPRLNARGGKNVAIKTGTGQKLVLQVPLTMTWGANEMVDEQSGRRSYSINFALDKKSTTYKAMKAFEEKVIADAATNSKKWFGQSSMSAEVIKALFYPVLKYPKDKQSGEIDYDRDPTLKVKLPYWDEKFTMELYDMESTLIFDKDNQEDMDIMSELPQRSHVACLIECGGVWFAAGRCGVTWKFLQGKRRKPVKIEGFCMLDDSDEEDAVEQIEHTEAQEGGGAAAESEEPPTPKKKKTKRAVKKEGI